MKNYKVIYFLILGIILVSCGSVKEGFTLKKNTNDEFLVEKKMPLKMPPNFNELPTPNPKENITEDENEIKSLISKTEKNSQVEAKSEEVSQTTKKSLLEKIKKN